ncbi:glycosyltransferase [Aquisalimonas lutea]|uniref:glycosyltransferase n=1 Tax=Aquisalimonas lutea TaxID=1327750 RepID=UPI0025B3943F|nr:glycosyltransferase [Aquisalimonas lutea]MDN3517194.1 glycosyltransferase [Aquisalimonas lutea]
MTEKKAITTITIGANFENMALYTHPLLKAYAERCGADFLVINERRMHERLNLASYEKFQLYQYFDEYERIAFIDTDILIAPDAPSVFDLTPINMIGAATEELYSKSQRDKELTQTELGCVQWDNVYFNSGMMVLSRNQKELLNPDAEGLEHWAKGDFRKHYKNLLNDQPFINHRSNKLGFRVHDLTHRFNHTRVLTDTKNRFNSYFIHYSGPSGHRYGKKLEQIKLDAQVMNRSFLLWLSRNLPAYRWLADRMHRAFLHHLVDTIKR